MCVRERFRENVHLKNTCMNLIDDLNRLFLNFSVPTRPRIKSSSKDVLEKDNFVAFVVRRIVPEVSIRFELCLKS